MDLHGLQGSVVTSQASRSRTPAWLRDNCVTRQPLSQLSAVMRMIDGANGLFLFVSGLFGVWGALTNLQADDVLQSLGLSIYVTGFGAMLMQFELRLNERVLLRDYAFLYTFLGRFCFLLLIGNLAWTCDPLGLAAAIITNSNVLLHLYIMTTHPAFVSGRVGCTALLPASTQRDASSCLFVQVGRFELTGSAAVTGNVLVPRDPASVVSSSEFKHDELL